jgi:hypothetical protein
MILDNLIEKKDLELELQTRYDYARKEEIQAKKVGATYTATHHYGVMVACVKIGENFDIKLKQE